MSADGGVRPPVGGTTEPLKPRPGGDAAGLEYPPSPAAKSDLDAIERAHYRVDWQECDENGMPNLDRPLQPFCGDCTDEEWVGAIEYGDTIDREADVVYWPCTQMALVAEVRRLRAVFAALADEVVAVEIFAARAATRIRQTLNEETKP